MVMDHPPLGREARMPEVAGQQGPNQVSFRDLQQFLEGDNGPVLPRAIPAGF